MFKLKKENSNIYVTYNGFKFAKIKFNGAMRKKSYLGGLVTLKTDKFSGEEKLRVLGFVVRKKKASDKLKYMMIYKRIKAKEKYKTVYMFEGAPSGEMYIFLNLLKNQDNINENEILFVVDKKFKKDLCKYYFPNIDCILLDKIHLGFNHLSQFTYKNINYIPIFTTEHYLKQDRLINEQNIHYYEYIKKALKCKKENITFSLPDTSDTVKERIGNYIEKHDLKNFIILSPEANTCEQLNKTFWEKLCNELHQQGYKVFLNIMNVKNYIDNCYINYFNYQEIIELAKNAKGIIGLRSGLMEIFSTLNVPINCLYTSFPQRDDLQFMRSAKALSGFTLKKLPSTNADKIYEYDVNAMTLDNIQEQILKNL